ncbi:uncharacterized protein LOC127841050 isoform X2 [Dreissena polymorpha]|nr:uncharacterized protein LOC127841050 isoform X2 [Dreissena polymorpha]
MAEFCSVTPFKLCILFLCTLIIMTLSVYINGKFIAEFGNVLSQGEFHVNRSDSDSFQIVEFAVQYCKKRSVWCLPRSNDVPEVESLRRSNLFYSMDDSIPFLYDGTVTDRFGNQHGITNMFYLGSVYRLRISWIDGSSTFTHTFTISVHPEGVSYVFSHTCFIRSVNDTKTSSGPTKSKSVYIFPIGTSYFRDFVKVNLNSEYYSLKKTDNELKHDLEDSIKNNKKSSKQSDQVNKKVASNDSNFLRVMTFNIWNMNSLSEDDGGYTRRMTALRDVILSSDPDILGLQEVRYEAHKGETLGPCQIHTFADWLPNYQFVYQPAQMQPNTLVEGRTDEGVAIMSKFPIISWEYHKLFINRSNSADTHQRILLQADIYVPHIGIVHVFTTHLSLSHEAREKSVEQIWSIVKAKQGPAIVMGDFNAKPHEKAMRFLKGFAKKNDSKLIDVWSFTNTDKGFTFSALQPNLTKRIDYIFFKPGPDCCLIHDCYTVDDGARSVEAASDHLPVVAEIKTQSKKNSL